MGYMGFGMRKEVYTRKPRTSFSRIKEVYGDHMEDFGSKRNITEKWSEKDRKSFKKFVTAKLRKKNISEDIYNYFILAFVIVIVGVALYYGISLLFG